MRIWRHAAAVNSSYRQNLVLPVWSIAAMYALRIVGWVLSVLWLWCATASGATADNIVVGDFARDGLSGWEPIRFKGETYYRLVDAQGMTALHAESRGTASGLVRKIKVDLTQTPILRWRWRVANTLRNGNERNKHGDDYPARIYVIFKSGFLSLKTQSLNYVWSSHQANGTTWPNAYTDDNQMVALRSVKEPKGVWFSERRNVRDDFRRLFGRDVTTVHAVAVMTDTDNTGQSAAAWYADIRFTAE